MFVSNYKLKENTLQKISFTQYLRIKILTWALNCAKSVVVLIFLPFNLK